MANQDFVEVGGGEVWDQSKPIQGTYVQELNDVGPNSSKMYTIRTSEGDVNVWGSTVLDTKFSQLKIGQEVRVEFLGLSKRNGKFGKPFKEYKVLARPMAAPVQEAKLDKEGEIDLSEINY